MTDRASRIAGAQKDWTELLNHVNEEIRGETWRLPPEALFQRILLQINRSKRDILQDKYNQCRDPLCSLQTRSVFIRVLKRVSESFISCLLSMGVGATSAASSSSDEPVITRTRTREERDAEGRANAIDLDLESPPAKKPTKEAQPSTSSRQPPPSSGQAEPAGAAAGSSDAPAAAAPSPPAGATNLDLSAVDGLADLVRGLPAVKQQAALAWCTAQELASTELIVEAERSDELVAALGFAPAAGPPVAGEVVVRKRLAKLSSVG